MTYRQQEQLKPKKTLKEANQQLSACLQLVIHVFIDSGVSPARYEQCIPHMLHFCLTN